MNIRISSFTLLLVSAFAKKSKFLIHLKAVLLIKCCIECGKRKELRILISLNVYFSNSREKESMDWIIKLNAFKQKEFFFKL